MLPFWRKVNNMKEYELILNPAHIAPLLEALRLHQVAIENSPGVNEQEKALICDLVRRAELLEAVIDAGDDLNAAQAAYNSYLEHGDSTAQAILPDGSSTTIGNAVKVMTRPL